jgi:N-acetylneuraminic acid mutarotase
MKQTFPLLLYLFMPAAACGLLWGCAEEPDIREELVGAECPEVAIDSIGMPRATEVTVYANVLQENGAAVTETGFQWRREDSDARDYSHGDSMKVGSGGKGPFSLVIQRLKDSTGYYVRPYARNRIGTGYGEEAYFTTRQGLGSIETLDASDIQAGSFVIAAKILRHGEGEILRRGFYFARTPLTSSSAVKDSLVSEAQTDSFTCTLTDLRPSTTYYVQAFVTNSFGTVFGLEKSVTTHDGRSSVAEPKVVSVSYTEVTLQGNVTDAGEAPVTERGFCYSSIYPDPTAEEGDTVPCGDGQGVFKGALKALKPSTVYYVRAYAVNKYGVYYGEVISFRTLNELPEVRTLPIVIEQPGVLRVSGEVTNVGNMGVPVAGICWSVNANPTVEDNKQQIARGVGMFTTTLHGMRGGITYYVRAFAQTDSATVYGDQQTIETPAIFATAEAFNGHLRAVRSASYVTLGARGYLVGGDDGLSTLNELYVYESSRGWQQQRSYSAKRSWMLAAAVGGGETKDVIVTYGGVDESSVVSEEFNYYDPTFNIWHAIDYESENRPGAMYGGAGCAQGDVVYFLGGIRREATGDVITRDVRRINLATPNQYQRYVWEQLSAFPESFYGGFAAVIGDTLYAGLGLRTSGATPVGNRKFHFSPDGGMSWEKLPDMPGSGVYLAGVVHGRNIYVADTDGGLWMFDTGRKAWTRKSTLPEAWQGAVHCIFSVGGYIYIGIGADRKSTLRYFPEWDVTE